MIPYSMNPLGRNRGSGIYGYAKGATMLLDGIDNTGAGFDASSVQWKDLTGNGFNAVSAFGDNPVWSQNGGLVGGQGQRVLNTQDSPLAGASQFTIEIAIAVPTIGTAWFVNTRNPWNNSATRGFQMHTLNSLNAEFMWSRGIDSSSPIVAPSIASYRTLSYTYDGASDAFYADAEYIGGSSPSGFLPLAREDIDSAPFFINGITGNLFSMNRSDMRLFSVRVWHRALTLPEIQRNSKIDLTRFVS